MVLITARWELPQLPALNELAWRKCEALTEAAERLNVAVSFSDGGARIIDCGVQAAGGLEAGRRLAEICMADCGRVEIVPGRAGEGVAIVVRTDLPVAACMAAQYAGWQIRGEKFYAMGSGPMRAAAGREPLLTQLGLCETAERVVGVLETGKLPTVEVCEKIAAQCHVAVENLTLLVARTASIAGAVQVTARSIETTLHKLHELGYDLKNVVSGFGCAPLPPIAADDLTGIGRTNDAILYGGQVTLWVRDDDARLAEIGPKVPSSASRDFGEPFAAVFERYGRDFYKIDPLLFSPAEITFVNLATGRAQRFGELRPDVLARSFG
jgi:methenyltetrahydromethanopterin cyclohydrolase